MSSKPTSLKNPVRRVAKPNDDNDDSIELNIIVPKRAAFESRVAQQPTAKQYDNRFTAPQDALSNRVRSTTTDSKPTRQSYYDLARKAAQLNPPKRTGPREEKDDDDAVEQTPQQEKWVQETLLRAMQKGMMWTPTDAEAHDPTEKTQDSTETPTPAAEKKDNRGTNATTNKDVGVRKQQPAQKENVVHSKRERKGEASDRFNRKVDKKGLKRMIPVGPLLSSKMGIISEEAIFAPQTIDDLGIDSKLASSVKEILKIEKPTKIQQAAVPVILTGKDVLVKSDTGTGKTLTYVIPMVNRLLRRENKVERSEGTLGLIIVPTRELGIQIYEVLQKILIPFHWIVPGLIIGGEKKKSEKARLRKGVSILVATPGRLADHLGSTNAFLVNKLEMLVLDEADRLLDLGFEGEIRKILQVLDERKKVRLLRQNVLLSATLDDSVQRLADLSLQSPVSIGAKVGQENDDGENSGKRRRLSEQNGSDEGESEGDGSDADENLNDEMTIPSRIQQYYSVMPCKRRFAVLTGLILTKWNESSTCKLVVFLSTCDSVDYIYSMYEHLKTLEGRMEMPPIRFYRLHGNMSQKDRTETYFSYIKSPNGVLLCTDVAARGLDLPNVNLIVQYDPPGEPKDYVHRVGRTARLNKSGSALLFLMPSESAYVGLLEEMKFHIQEQTAEDFYHPFRELMRRDDLETAVAIFLKICEDQLDYQKELLDMAQRAYISYIRAYSTKSSDIKYIFHVRNLHLGHVAKSFCLSFTPSEISQSNQRSMKKLKRDNAETKKQQSAKVSMRKQQSSQRLQALKMGFGQNHQPAQQSTNKSRDMSIFD